MNQFIEGFNFIFKKVYFISSYDLGQGLDIVLIMAILTFLAIFGSYLIGRNR